MRALEANLSLLIQERQQSQLAERRSRSGYQLPVPPGYIYRSLKPGHRFGAVYYIEARPEAARERLHNLADQINSLLEEVKAYSDWRDGDISQLKINRVNTRAKSYYQTWEELEQDIFKIDRQSFLYEGKTKTLIKKLERLKIDLSQGLKNVIRTEEGLDQKREFRPAPVSNIPSVGRPVALWEVLADPNRFDQGRDSTEYERRKTVFKNAAENVLFNLLDHINKQYNRREISDLLEEIYQEKLLSLSEVMELMVAAEELIKRRVDGRDRIFGELFHTYQNCVEAGSDYKARGSAMTRFIGVVNEITVLGQIARDRDNEGWLEEVGKHFDQAVEFSPVNVTLTDSGIRAAKKQKRIEQIIDGDGYFITRDGTRKLIEAKSLLIYNGTLTPAEKKQKLEEILSGIFTQAKKYTAALNDKKYPIDEIEYVITAPNLDKDFIDKLSAQFGKQKVNLKIWVRSDMSSRPELRFDGSNLKPAGSDKKVKKPKTKGVEWSEELGRAWEWLGEKAGIAISRGNSPKAIRSKMDMDDIRKCFKCLFNEVKDEVSRRRLKKIQARVQSRERFSAKDLRSLGQIILVHL